jgi:hypothetical protein
MPPPKAHAPAGETAGPRRRDLRTTVVLSLVCLVVYNANLRLITAGDTFPARFLPFGIWRYGSVLLDPILDATAQGYPQPYWIVRGRGGHALSLYPLVLPVLIAPLYLPAVGYLHLRGWTADQLDRVAMIMEKLTASLIASVAVALMYLLLRRRAPPRSALLLACAFAFGTNTWMIGSQALWQHGFAELLLVAALFLLTGPCTANRALAVGALCGLIATNRPPDVLLAAALGLYGLKWAGRQRTLLAAGAAVPLGLVVTYNFEVAGSLAGGYGLAGRPTFFQHELLPGLAGLLLSPTRGLFIFSPFLLILPFYFRHAFRDQSTRVLTLLVSLAVVLQVLLYAKTDWRGGCSWGPRLLTDLLPLLVWMLSPVVAALSQARRRAFLLVVGTSIAIQAIGAFWYTSWSDLAIFAVRSGPEQMKAAWNPRNTPFIAELPHGPARRNLLPRFDHRRRRGSVRSLEPRQQFVEAAVRVRRDDLNTAVQYVSASLKQHQQPGGFWLTSHTRTPRFEDPKKEMNTYVTSVITDLLDPVAASAGLAESVRRARQHLTDQIESTGLVRYHGRPDGPTIPELGCVITPDADDTALVWRIAPSGQQSLWPRALAILKRYRTDDGLYRIWLAPRREYRCVDPGTDPNPADAGVQMHVYQLLAKRDPPAARELCDALSRAITEDRIWVYCAVAPLELVLRQADLRRAGCPLRVPKARLATAAAGQEGWLAAGRLLDGLLSPEEPRPSSRETLALLRNLSSDDFSIVRRAPPLLYHNDVTGTTPRFYWSEDFGYALWLRLYIENARQRGSKG